MKIIQSLWSKPGKARIKGNHAIANACGWRDKKYNYFSWTLSCLQFKKYYPEVELVTDKEGYELLINRLKLPYTDVRVELDELEHYPPELWAIGKIYTYGIQDKPFIHADGDVIIWERFRHDLENSPLLCQSREEGFPFSEIYVVTFSSILQNFSYYPELLIKSIDRNNGILAINAGIIGGNDIPFFKDYVTQAFDFVDRNLKDLHKIDADKFNVIFEQFLFRALAEERQAPISFFHPTATIFDDYAGVPDKTKFIHTPGNKKQDTYFVNCLEYRLLSDYPDYYYKIIELLKANEI